MIRARTSNSGAIWWTSPHHRSRCYLPFAWPDRAGPYLAEDKAWIREVLRLTRAYDRGRISSRPVADYLAIGSLGDGPHPRFLRDRRIEGVGRFVTDPSELMRVPEELKKCVAFVMYKKEAQGEPDRFAGTAFWVGMTSERVNTLHFFYLVTAWHVLVGCQEKSTDRRAYLRFNLKDGSRGLYASDPSQWYRHPTDESVDLAAIPVSPVKEMDIGVYPIRSAATTQLIETENIGIGDRLFFPGLFARQASEMDRDVPVLRRGSIAAMPEQPVSTPRFGKIQAYLVEARSIGGISGSPVFVDLAGLRGTRLQDLSFNFQHNFYLLGVMHGHWDADDGLAEYDDEASGPEAEKQRRRMNMGIAVVVPVDKLIETLDHPELVRRRTEAEDKFMEDNMPVEDIADDETKPGPDPERLKIDDTLEGAVEKALRRKKPEEGWPDD